MKTISVTSFYLLLLLTLFPSVSFSTTIFVNQAAGGANNGTSWADAFTSLSDALAAADSAVGDTVWVAMGVYKPETLVDLNGDGGSDPREATFILPFNIKMYGGFVGNETSLSERDFETNLTILSGDIDNNDLNGDGNFIAENTGDIVGDNAYHVVYSNNVSSGLLLDGFIITAGSASIAAPVDQFDPNLDGGGWYNRMVLGWNSSSPNIFNTIFRGNFAESEGGAFFSVDSPFGQMVSTFRNCSFIENKADFGGGAVHLGSFSIGDNEPNFIKCQFIMNEAFRRGGALNLIGERTDLDSCLFLENKVTAISPDNSTLPGSGGAANLVSSDAEFRNCIFIGNSSTGNPTGPFEGGGGGAVYMVTNEPQTNTLGDSEPKFISCGFYSNTTGGNTASWGGAAVHLSDAGRLFPQYVNCVFNNNEAQNHGGAVANFARVITPPDDFTPALEPIFTNCTFTENSAGQQGGAIYHDGQVFMGSEILKTRIENSILWNDSAGAAGNEVINNDSGFVLYSLIEGSGGSGGGWNTEIGQDGGNNIDTDPLFVNEGDPDGADNIPGTLDDGLIPSGISPAVNSGNNAAPGLAGITTDFSGVDRILFVTVDMGAYERCAPPDQQKTIYNLSEWNDNKPWSFLLVKAFSNEMFFDKTDDGITPQSQLKEKESAEYSKSNLGNNHILPQHLKWDVAGQFIDYGDSALIVGKIKDTHKPGLMFNVHIKLINPETWEDWKASKKIYTAYSPSSLKTAFKEHKNWIFWELALGSYLEGTGDLSGKVFLQHWPANHKTGFQFGKGANGLDGDFGVSGLFSYEGQLTYKGNNASLKGIGSMNADAEECADCDPMAKDAADNLSAALQLPEEYSLAQNYPNPFNPVTNFEFRILNAGLVTLKVYDVLGKEVAVIVNEEMPAGQYNLSFNAAGLASGVYYYRITANDFTSTKKMILLK